MTPTKSTVLARGETLLSCGDGGHHFRRRRGSSGRSREDGCAFDGFGADVGSDNSVIVAVGSCLSWIPGLLCDHMDTRAR
jgi:hypothetical protein